MLIRIDHALGPMVCSARDLYPGDSAACGMAYRNRFALLRLARIAADQLGLDDDAAMLVAACALASPAEA